MRTRRSIRLGWARSRPALLLSAALSSAVGCGDASSPATPEGEARGGAAGAPSGASGSAGAQPASGGSGGATGGGSSGAMSGGSSGSGGGAGTAGEAGEGGSAPDPIATIRNGIYWDDVAGNRIEAHGGGFIEVSGTWYWIGEDKAHNAGTFEAVNCYASTDLEHWEFKNAIITRDTAPELDTSDRIIERPKVLFNEQTQEYVMWLHWDGNSYGDAEAGVFHSPTIDGDYELVRFFRPEGNMSRDDTLFKDDDGKAYFVSAANENADLVIYELTSDYLDVEREVTTLWAGSYREAPALFKAGDLYYLVTSGATGWDPNQAKYATAPSIEGPWSALSNVADGTTYDTQSTFVIPVQGTETTTYVFAADRWQDPDLASSKYIWLPLRVNGTALKLDYFDEWQLNLRTGRWSVNDGYLPQSDWSVLEVDSQETEGEDGRAENAFDDSPSTIWHTAYDSEAPPHALAIDLGATYRIEGMRYLPRQDKDDHGMVADYELYVSDDAADWGSPVASGTFDSARSEKVVTFTPKDGRYVRFVALSEINGQIWTSIAELDLAGSSP